MGKIKGRRSKASRYNPLAIPPNNEVSSISIELELNGCEKQAKNPGAGLKCIMEKAVSSVPEEIITGMNTLAAIALEKDAPESIVKEKLVSLIAPHLSNPSPLVRLASAGALRNLCISASDEVLEGMISQDIMQHLVQLLKEYSNIITADCDRLDTQGIEKGIANATDDSVPPYLIFIQGIHILWNLCEGNESALNTFNQEGLIHILLKHINPNSWGLSLSLPVAECLLCISENNEEATSTLLPAANELVAILSNLPLNKKNAKWLHFGVTLSGVLINIDYFSEGENLRVIFEILSSSLEFDISSYFSLFMNKFPKNQPNSPSISAEELEFILSSQQLSLEILSNLGCLGDDEDYCDYETASDSEDRDDEVMDIHSEFTSHSEMPSEIIEAIKYFQFVEKIKKKINIPLDSVCKDDLENELRVSLYEKFCQIRIRALQCFQNLMDCLDIEEVGGSKFLYDMWLELAQRLCSGNKTDASLQEAVSGLMRVIIDKLHSNNCQQLLCVNIDEIKQIFQAGAICTMGSVRANLARMVGNLGCFLIEKNTQEDLCEGRIANVLSSSTDHLLQVANADAELFVRAEALDVIIDLFSDDKTDQLAAQVHLVEKLKGVQPHFKAQYQKMKKKLGDHKPLVLTVRDNLSAFIAYKATRVSNHS